MRGQMNQMPMMEQEQENEAPGSASELLIKINSELNELGSMIDRSPLPDQDKARFASLMQNFMDFADNLGQPANASSKASMGNVPMETMGRPARQSM